MSTASSGSAPPDIASAATGPAALSVAAELPSITFLVHAFNRRQNIDQLVQGLKRIGGHEIIVCDDGSSDGSRATWRSYLTEPGEVLVFSNDLHEIRILDRAIRCASGDIVCLVQDDDQIPRGTAWLDEVLGQFRRHPDLAIIGGFMGFLGFAPDPSKVTRFWDHAPFRFVDHVNIGPYFVRRSGYEALGGWDHSFSAVGEPGICFDNELCLRAWLHGFTVGYRFVPFKGEPGVYAQDGGTVLFSATARRRNQLRNEQAIFALYGTEQPLIAARVARANARLSLQMACTTSVVPRGSGLTRHAGPDGSEPLRCPRWLG